MKHHTHIPVALLAALQVHAATDATPVNIPGLEKLSARGLHPGKDKPAEVTSNMNDGAFELRVPLSRGCAMVTLSSAVFSGAQHKTYQPERRKAVPK